MSKTFHLYATTPEARKEESRQARKQLNKEIREEAKAEKKARQKAVRARRVFCKENNRHINSIPLSQFMD